MSAASLTCFRVQLFAWLREMAGTSVVEVEINSQRTTATAVIEAVLALPQLAPAALSKRSLILAVNQVYAPADQLVVAGDELALVPPVSGGAPVYAQVVATPIVLDELRNRVITPGTGAVVIFEGVTRDVDSLEYEAYVAMAEASIAGIAESALLNFSLEGIAIEHRVGSVPRSEPSVVVAVSARHRPEAFAAARSVINTIKAQTPIWKREIEGARSTWVAGSVPRNKQEMLN